MKRKRIKSMSSKRRAEQELRRAVVLFVLTRDAGCQAAALVPEVACWHPSWLERLDGHEIIPQSAWDAGYLEPSNCVAVCRGHHQWIDANPDLAHAVGLHGYSWERPDGHAGMGEAS